MKKKNSQFSTIEELKKNYDEGIKYLNSLKKNNLLDSSDESSDFWKDIFNEKFRQNFPSFNELLIMRRGATYPLADRPGDLSLKDEFNQASSAMAVTQATVPCSFIKNINESAIGSPICFLFENKMLSGGFITNILTTFRIIEILKKQRVDSKKLKILEIGAGYGQVAYQLSQFLDIERYDICDLPENLFLSSYYLKSNFPSKNFQFLFPNQKLSPKNDGLFLIPNHLKRLNIKYDLIINSFSFQEMTLESVETYFDFAKNNLSLNGLFYSLNSHGKSGVVVPDDYPIDNFEIINFEPVKFAPYEKIFSTTPYELVLKPGRKNASLDKKKKFSTLAKVMQTGLSYELLNLCQKISSNKFTNDDQKLLNCLGNFFELGMGYQKRQFIETFKPNKKISKGIINYLLGCAYLIEGNKNLAQKNLIQAIPNLSSSQAKMRSYLILAAIGSIQKPNKSNPYLKKAIQISPHLEDDLNLYQKNIRNLISQIASSTNTSYSKVSIALKHVLRSTF